MSENASSVSTNNNPVQIIGLDIGRGYVKGYSKYNNNVKECIFKSITSLGRDGLDYSNYDETIYIDYNGKKIFAGNLAEKEGYLAKSNSSDLKDTLVVEELIAVALSKLAVAKDVKIMLGVPYKSFKRETLENVVNKFKGKVFKVEDLIDGGVKEVKLSNIDIFREADSALVHALNGLPNMEKPVGLISVGFRSTELAYYEKGFRFNDKKSTTLELGNRNILEFVKDYLSKQKNIDKTVEEIDTSDDYDDLKAIGYENISEQVSQEVEVLWKNIDEMEVYIAGGTSLNMTFNNKFKVLEDSQMATAKGLYEIAEIRSQKGKF